MTDARAFRGFRFPAEVILWAVRWYLRFPISYRDLELHAGRPRRRGRPHDHVPLGPALRPRAREARCAGICGPAAGRGTSTRPTSGSAVSGATCTGRSTAPAQTIDFLLSAKRDKKAAKRFFRKALGRENTRNPRTS